MQELANDQGARSDKVLLSIRPKFSAQIFSGRKRFEFRRAPFRRPDISTAIVYETSPTALIVGEFQILGVVSDAPEALWRITAPHGGISKEEYESYFSDCDLAYAVQVGRTSRYSTCVALSQLEIGLRPPQSFQYITPSHYSAIRLLELYGFRRTNIRDNGECWYEKAMMFAPDHVETREELLPAARKHYPSFVAGPPALSFCVPVQGQYHHRLFPEIAMAEALPLFPELGNLLPPRGEVKPGNTIRKVYLCKANNRRAGAGDILLFYKSKTAGALLSQSLTSVGVVESVFVASTWEELARETAKRSVFSDEELASMVREGSIYGMNFLLVGHLEPAIKLGELTDIGVVKSAPQSIAGVPADAFRALRERMHLTYEP